MLCAHASLFGPSSVLKPIAVAAGSEAPTQRRASPQHRTQQQQQSRRSADEDAFAALVSPSIYVSGELISVDDSVHSPDVSTPSALATLPFSPPTQTSSPRSPPGGDTIEQRQAEHFASGSSRRRSYSPPLATVMERASRALAQQGDVDPVSLSAQTLPTQPSITSISANEVGCGARALPVLFACSEHPPCTSLAVGGG